MLGVTLRRVNPQGAAPYRSADGGVSFPRSVGEAKPGKGGRLAGNRRVRNIAPQWRNLAEGFLGVEDLEARFRAEWGPRLEEARRKKEEDERQRSRERGRAAILAASVLVFALFALALVLRLLSFGGTTAVLVLAVVVPAILTLYGAWALQHTPDPLPDPSDLSGRWWRTVSAHGPSVRRPGPALEARGYGDQGEEALVSLLSEALSGDYVALRGPLVARNLDADLVVAGPTGVWVYEVKHWSGEITCRGGQWRRTKTYRERGGRLVRETQNIRPFDGQWAKEASAVREALRLGLPGHLGLHGAVGGGLVFTHPGLSFSQDGSCRAWYGRPGSCPWTISRSPEVPAYTTEGSLRVLDALLERSDRLHEQKGAAPWATSSAVELAQRLHEEAVARARSYLPDAADGGEPASAVPDAEAQEPRKRAVYYPHPDDPPKD